MAAGFTARWRYLEQWQAMLRLLLLLQLLWIAATLVFDLASSFYLALAMYWAVDVIRTLHGPIYGTWLNRQIDSRVRATVLSVVNQSDSFGQFTGGPMLGGVGTLSSLRVAMVGAAMVLIPALGFFANVAQLSVEE